MMKPGCRLLPGIRIGSLAVGARIRDIGKKAPGSAMG